MEDRCICCGEIVPEGRQVCGKCEASEAELKEAVEVVRCKDCKYFYCCSAVDRMFYCRHPQGLKHVEAVEKDSYCSYGKKKESEGK